MATSDDTSLRKTPLRIDELTRGDHPHLLLDDVVFYFGDYTARAGYEHSECNQLVFNLKKPMKYRGSGQWAYKTKAIERCAQLIRPNVANILGQISFVPVPPSKVKDDEGFDDSRERQRFPVTAVLMEQQSQRELGMLDEYFIAKVYQHCSAHSIMKAQMRALQHELEAKEYLGLSGRKRGVKLFRR